jgi:hypothetical protein
MSKKNSSPCTHRIEANKIDFDFDFDFVFLQVFYGNQNTCLKINPRQIQKIVNRAAELQDRGPEFLDLLSMIVKVTGTGLTLKRNQAYVMKYIMQNYKKLAFVLDLPREERYFNSLFRDEHDCPPSV